MRAVTLNAVVAAFAALDVVLVVAAARHASGSPAVDPIPVEYFQPTTTPTALLSIPAVRAPETRSTLLSFSSATNGWRATAGCTRAAGLVATTDAGRTWQSVSAPVPHVLRIDMTGPESGWLVGATTGCTLEFFETSDGGASWTAVAGLGEAWVVLKDRLRLPSGRITVPCGRHKPVKGIAPAGTQVALVVCGSGLSTTADGGVTWSPAGVLPDGGDAVAAALVPGSAGRGVALVTGATGCAATQVVRTSNAGRTWSAGTCLTSIVAPTSVSLASDGAGLALGAHGAARTTDVGRSWS